MSIIGNNILAGASGSQEYKIDRSLRFNSGDSAHLTRTPSSASNSTTFTWSAWIKVDASTGTQMLFSATSSGSLQYDFVLTSNQLDVYGIETVFVYDKKLSRVFRDPSAWYHLVVAFDTTDSTAEDRIKIYVNGERETDFATNTNPSASRTTGFNKTVEHSIGGRTGYSTGSYFNGYQTEINFIDGSQLGPENFGETDSDTGAWIPKKYSGTYGTNGFYLNFSNNSGVTATTLGKDNSGNGNNWTPNNFSVTAGAGNDSLEDTPTNNHATFNAIDHQEGSSTFSEGNLKVVTTSSGTGRAISTIRPTSGKWYCEFTVDDATRFSVGVENGDRESSTQGGNSTNSVIVFYTKAAYFNSTSTNNYLDANISNGNTIQVALDLDNNAVYVGRNNTWGNSATASEIASGTTTNSLSAFVGSTNMLTGDVGVFVEDNSGSGTMGATANFGQRAFTYTPPTGFKALNAKNTPVPTIKNGTEYFSTSLWTGNGSSQNIDVEDNLENTWQPDWAWLKSRTINYQHSVYDAVRGASAGRLATDQTLTEVDRGVNNPSFISTGITVRNTLNDNASGQNFVGWFWKANGSGSTNSDGTISSTASVNADAGFSIVGYTGNGVSNATVGHGLGVTPALVISKTRTGSTAPWYVKHKDLDSGKNINLNSQAAQAALTGSGGIGNLSSSTTITLANGSNNNENVNASGRTYITYCFAEVEGYSKFGSYTGNGSTDGTFVYTGFRPAFVMAKRIDSTGSWYIFDNTRGAFNETEPYSLANAGNNEATDLGWDLLSNGFKHRTSYLEQNHSGGSFIYMAFAETPFKYANAR